MAHALVFHSAADSESVKAMLVGLNGLQVLPIRGPVPARVQFGGRVVMVWSSHAAAEYAAGAAPPLPRNSVVVCLDDTPLPAIMTTQPLALRAQGDGADSGRLMAALSAAPAARRPVGTAARPALDRARRPSPLPRPAPEAAAAPVRAKGAARRQTQSASVVLSASAFGTLTAVALGSVFPADTIVTPSFAATPNTESTTASVAHQIAAQARPIAAVAGFDGVMAPSGVSVTFSADEMQALTDKLAQSDQELSAARAWSDGLINRLQGLSARAPDAMPAMGAVPRGPSTSANAQPAGEAASLAQGEPAGDALVLRDRFTQVEPMNYAVDRIADIAAAAPTVERNSGV